MKRSWLKGLAIALIILPEPFTTPFGIVLLLVSFIVPKRHKDSLSNLETLVKRYIQLRNYGHSLNNNSRGTVNIPGNYHKRSSMETRNGDVKPHVTAWHEYVDKKTRAEYQYHYINDSRKVSNKVIHHVLQTSLPQYTAAPEKSGRVLPPGKNIYYSGLRPIRPVRQTKVIHHSLKRI